MHDKTIESAYTAAPERYGELGVDTDAAPRAMEIRYAPRTTEHQQNEQRSPNP